MPAFLITPRLIIFGLFILFAAVQAKRVARNYPNDELRKNIDTLQL